MSENKVLLVLVDGMRADSIAACSNPAYQKFFEEGAHTYKAQTESPHQRAVRDYRCREKTQRRLLFLAADAGLLDPAQQRLLLLDDEPPQLLEDHEHRYPGHQSLQRTHRRIRTGLGLALSRDGG